MQRLLPTGSPVDVRRTLDRLTLHMHAPSSRWHEGAYWAAFHCAQGPATVRYRGIPAGVEVHAWGPGAAEALADADAHLGLHDSPEDFESEHPIVGPLLRRHGPVRIGRTGRVIEALVPVIIGQKVTGKGAGRSWRQLVRALGEPAPRAAGAPELWLAPEPTRFSELAYYDLHRFGIERRRAQIILAVTRRARRLEALVARGADALEARLLAFRGVGPWTVSHVRSAVMGDPDAVVVGDYKLPHVIVHALVGEARGDDAQMLELLEPFRPHRARVVELLKRAGGPPRFGPRLPVRDIRKH